jgi:hypothetical protein
MIPPDWTPPNRHVQHRGSAGLAAQRVRALAQLSARIAVVAGALLLAAGCSQKASIGLIPPVIPPGLTLSQPAAPRPGQREVKLNGGWLYYAPAGNRCRYLLGFPLPGATNGPRAFVIYLAAPNRTGALAAQPAAPSTAPTETPADEAVHGFLIQELGQLAGKTEFVSGSVTVRAVWLARDRRRLAFDLRCADNTHIGGEVEVREVQSELSMFERQFAADIALFMNATSQPANAAQPTATRSAIQP